MDVKSVFRFLLPKRYGRQELFLLIGVMALAGALWLFLEIADYVKEPSGYLDRRILLGLRNPSDHSDPIGPFWMEELGRDLTALGSVGVLSVMALSVAGYLLCRRRWKTCLFLLAAVGGGMLFGALLKHGFDRPRPDLVPHAARVFTSSFPSGHSMVSAVTYLTLAALLTRTQSGRTIKIYFMSVAIFLTLVVGASRVYLGVHWPTDVAAGWTAGAFWAILCWLVAQLALRRKETDDNGKEKLVQKGEK